MLWIYVFLKNFKWAKRIINKYLCKVYIQYNIKELRMNTITYTNLNYFYLGQQRFNKILIVLLIILHIFNSSLMLMFNKLRLKKISQFKLFLYFKYKINFTIIVNLRK